MVLYYLLPYFSRAPMALGMAPDPSEVNLSEISSFFSSRVDSLNRKQYWTYFSSLIFLPFHSQSHEDWLYATSVWVGLPVSMHRVPFLLPDGGRCHGDLSSKRVGGESLSRQKKMMKI